MERREYQEDGIIEAVSAYTESVKDAREKQEYGTLAAPFEVLGGKVKEMRIQTTFKQME